MKAFRIRVFLTVVGILITGLLILGHFVADDTNTGLVLGWMLGVGVIGGIGSWFLVGWLAEWYLGPLFQLFRKASANKEGRIPDEPEIRQVPELMFLRDHFNYMASTIHDQSHRLMEKALQTEKAQRIKTDFVRNMSHHLRTPLNTVLGASEVFQQQALPDEQRELAQVIHRGVHDLSQAVTNLLTLSEIDSAMIRTTPVWIDLQPEVEALLETICETVGVTRQRVVLRYGDQAPSQIFYDLRYFKQMLFTFVRILLRFSEKEPLIIVFEQHDENTFACSVQTSELQLTKEELQDVFDRFPKIGTQYNQQYPGLSINLALVQELAEFQGGGIHASRLPGGGCRFVFTLPLQFPAIEPAVAGHSSPSMPRQPNLEESSLESINPEELLPPESRAALQDDEDSMEPEEGFDANQSQDEKAEAQAVKSPQEANTNIEEQPATKAQPETRAWSVLIAEDDTGNQFIFKQYLEHRPGKQYEVRFAKNGHEVMEHVKYKVPDLILMDIMMPQMGGVEATRLLQEDPLTQSIPIVAITSMATGADRETIMADAFSGFLSKPVMVEDFYRVLDQFLE